MKTKYKTIFSHFFFFLFLYSHLIWVCVRLVNGDQRCLVIALLRSIKIVKTATLVLKFTMPDTSFWFLSIPAWPIEKARSRHIELNLDKSNLGIIDFLILALYYITLYDKDLGIFILCVIYIYYLFLDII